VRRFFYPLLVMTALIFLPGDVSAQGEPIDSLAKANEVLEQAHFAFDRGDFSKALDIYTKVAESGYGTAQVWFNAGTAAYRAGDKGKAVLYYSRALRQDPGYERASRSLQFISPASNEGNALISSNAIERFFRQREPSTWVLIAQVFFILVCVGLGKAMAARTSESRGHWLAVMGWSFAFTVIFAGVAYYSFTLRLGSDEAVIMVDGASARSAPSSSSPAKLELPAGTIVSLDGTVRNDYVRVTLADGEAGFVALEQLEKI